MPDPAMVDAGYLAERFGRSRDWVSRNKDRLIADHRFPPPSAVSPRLWHRRQVDAWFDYPQRADGRDPVAADPAWADWLDRRAAELADQVAPSD